MAKKNTGSRRNHEKKIAQELMESMESPADFDPIKRQLKINQFNWTQTQKDFLKLPYITTQR